MSISPRNIFRSAQLFCGSSRFPLEPSKRFHVDSLHKGNTQLSRQIVKDIMASNLPITAIRPTLFNLPRELRQHILIHTIDFTQFGEYHVAYTARPYNLLDSASEYFDCWIRYNRHIGAWNIELLDVGPLQTRREWQEDVDYVCSCLRGRLMDSLNRFIMVRSLS